MPSLAELKEKAAKAKAVKKEKERSLLYGSGLTKRLAERAEKKFEKERLIETKLTEPISPEPTNQLGIIETKLGEKIEYDEYQDAAITGILTKQFSTIIGQAGTGKTTTLREFLHRLVSDAETDKETGNRKLPGIAFCAYTGRAAQQMKRALPKEFHVSCSTIHALLAFKPVSFEITDPKTGDLKTSMHFEPTFDRSNKLTQKIIVVDEAGMVGLRLWNQLMDALLPGTKIILLGDINQLPPVQDTTILGHAMLKWPTFELKKIHRQAADNPIIANADNILHGRMPKKYSNRFDFCALPGNAIDAQNKVYELVKALTGLKQFDPMQDAIIVPQNKGQIGQVEFNNRLVMFFNPEKKDENGISLNKRTHIHTGMAHVLFAVGDKVMLLQNDNERGLTNGMLGVIISIAHNGQYDLARSQFTDNTAISLDSINWDEFKISSENDDEEERKETAEEKQRQASHIMTVQFADGQEISFGTAGEYRQITHAYAFTCHKSQGGEYRNVVIVCHSANSIMLNREWLYTAVTRAKERVILAHNSRGIVKAIAKQRLRGTTVEEKARSFLALQESKENAIQPILEL
jgi:exodeoxyribonuclease V alpha subunit